MATPQSAVYGSWAERQCPQQVLWEKRISKNEPEALDAVLRMFGSSGPIQKNLHNTESNLKIAQSMMNKGEYIPPRNSQVSRDVYNTVRNKYTNLFAATATGINQHNTNFLPPGAKPRPGIVQSPAAKFVDAFQPVSTFIGTTLHTMPGMASSNLVNGICPSVGGLLERITPRFKQDMMSVQSALKLDELSHLPSQIMGSVRHVTSAVNKLLEAPAHIIYDLFKGAINAVQKMSALVNGVFKNLTNLATKAVGMVAGALGGIVQGIVGNIMNVVGGFASKIQGLMSAFGGMSLLSNFSSSLLGKLGSNALGGIGANILGGVNIKNPLDASKLFANPKLGELRGFQLNNPLDIKNKFIPPSVGSNMDKVLSKSSSFGMIGNCGHGLANSLDSVKSGVLASVLRNFSSQAGILSHMFTGQEPQPQNHIIGNNLTNGYDGTKYATDVSRNVVRQYPPNFIIPHKS